MKKNVIRVAVAALLVCAAGTARAVTTHRMTDTDISYSGGFITTSGVLVFPGKTLADLEAPSRQGCPTKSSRIPRTRRALPSNATISTS